MTNETDTDREWTIDRICKLTTRASFLNALHACRPNHPWNKTAVRPWREAYFLAEQGHFLELPYAAIDWLRRQAETESKP